MAAPKIYLKCETRLYADLIVQLFQELGVEVEQGTAPVHKNARGSPGSGSADRPVIMIYMEDRSGPPDSDLPQSVPSAKQIVFSPDCRAGYRRLPGENSWEEIRPFGLADLLDEVLVSS